MKCALFLYTGSDGTKAEQLKDYLQGKLRAVADLRNITDILAEEQDVKDEMASSDCVVLIGSRKASSLIQNDGQETEDEFVIFDGGVIREMFTANHERLVIVFFTERTENDWIPAGFDEKKIFHLSGEKIQRGNPVLDRIEDCIKGVLLGKNRV